MEGAVKIDVPAGQDNRGLYGCLAGNSGEDGEQRCLGERESDCVLQAEDCDGWGLKVFAGEEKGLCVCVCMPVQGCIEQNDRKYKKF